MFKNMHLPRFSKVCFCFPLRIGNIVLVYFNLILSIVACLLYLYLDLIKYIIRLFTVSSSDWMHRMVRSKMVPHYVVVFIFAYALSEIVMSTVVLIGLHKKKIKLITAYMYYATFVSIAMLACRLWDRGNDLWYIELVIDLVYIGFKSYYILLIRSQYKTMQAFGEENVCASEIEMNATCEEEKGISDLNLKDVQRIDEIIYEKCPV